MAISVEQYNRQGCRLRGATANAHMEGWRHRSPPQIAVLIMPSRGAIARTWRDRSALTSRVVITRLSIFH